MAASKKWDARLVLPLISPEAFRSRREDLGMSQRGLAAACGCSKAAISQLERGVQAGAVPALATALAWRLGVPLGEVFVVPDHARVDAHRRP